MVLARPMRFEDLKGKLKREAMRVARKLSGASNDKAAELALDFTEDERKVLSRVRDYTMTSPARVVSLVRAVDYIVAQAIPGDFVECGVAAGGSIMAMAIRLKMLGAANRRIWLYDTFEGMSEPTDHDRGRFGEPAGPRYRKRLKDGVSTWINHPLERVKAAIATTGYPETLVEYVKGKVEETLRGRLPGPLALLRLDTDWHASTAAEMEHLWPLLAPGGIAIADDYYRWQGSRKAIDEYLAARRIRVFWSRIDEHAAIAVKQG